jgi:hypothetical protein
VPKFDHIQPRDLKIYMQNDRVRNILHDNENLAKLANSSQCVSTQITTLTKMNTTQTNFIVSPQSQTDLPSRFAPKRRPVTGTAGRRVKVPTFADE